MLPAYDAGSFRSPQPLSDSRSRMRPRRHFWSFLQLSLTGLVLLTYGTTGVFRYSLHTVFDCEHCVSGTCEADAYETGPQDPGDLATAASCPCCHEHEHATVPTTGRTGVVSHEGKRSRPHPSLAAEPSSCPICAFLAQAQSPLAHSSDIAQVAFLPGERQIDELPTPQLFVSFSLARGPPTV
ncbi:hypothetical protein HG15A2_20180 [Adhaeretor mobilis]|uniref:Uncharacterized protein n=1 Tax=Adhaeretor mobilis TaxID=1930276 RepID=A0A517MV35_9BACT|nr:hypothetical protein HG15A2_20180 [Adhaeretor mobilis]